MSAGCVCAQPSSAALRIERHHGDWLTVTDDFSTEFLRLRFARLVGADAELSACTNSMSSSLVKGVESNMRF